MLEHTAGMPASPGPGPSSGVPTNGPCSLEHLDNLCRLMEKLGELRNHNSQLQRRVQYLEDLKGLRGHAEAGTATAEEAIMKATEERFLGPASNSNAKSFVKIGKRSGKFKPLQYSMSHTFGEDGKRKESKWSKVKGALGLERSSTAVMKQTSPCSSAGQSPNVKRSLVKAVDTAERSDSSSSSEELDPYFTLNDITADYDGSTQQAGSPISQRKSEEGYRRSKSLEGEALFNHLRCTSPSQRPQNRTPWGVVKGLIKTAKGHRHENSRLSIPSDQIDTDALNNEHSVLTSQTEDVHNSQDIVVNDANNVPEVRDESMNGQCRSGEAAGPRRPSKWTKVKKAFLSGPVGPTLPITSSPNSPNRHSSFVYDPDWDVSGEAATIPRDEIRRSYLSLQQRLSQEFQRKRLNWERGAGVITEGAATSVEPLKQEDPAASTYGDNSDFTVRKSSTTVSISDDQNNKNHVSFDGRESSSPHLTGRLAWQRLRKSRTAPAVPLGDGINAPVTKTISSRETPQESEGPVDGHERGLRWLQKELNRVEREKMRLERERDRVLRREAKQRRQEVLVRTSGGLFRFQGISHQFTRRLFEWERSQGIPPQDSTLALLNPEYVDSGDIWTKLARSRSEGIVGTRIPQDDDDEDDDDGTALRNRILHFGSTYINRTSTPPKLLRPKDFNSRFCERFNNPDSDLSTSAIQEWDIAENIYGSRDTPVNKPRFRPKRTRAKFHRQSAQELDDFSSKQVSQTEESQEQKQAAIMVSALSTQLLSLAQELEASLGSKLNSNSPSLPGTAPLQSKTLPDTEDVTRLPSRLTTTVLQLRQGLKVLCKDHAENPTQISNVTSDTTEKPSKENDDEEEREDDDDEDETELTRRWNKRKLKKSTRKVSCNDPLTPAADVFVPTTRKIFSPIGHDAGHSVVTYIVDEPTKDSDKHSDTSSTAGSDDQSERACPPPVQSPPVPPILPSLTPITSPMPISPIASPIPITSSSPIWKSPSVRNVCSVATPAWLRTSGSRSQSSSPALRRRLTPPALPQSPTTSRRDKETAPSIRMMIAKYNQSPTIPPLIENTPSTGNWKAPGVEKRVRLQMEKYEQGIRTEETPGCVQKSASAGTIRPPGILKSSSVGSIKTRLVPPPAATAARLRTLRLQRAKLEFLSRTPQVVQTPESSSSVPLIKSASASVIECFKNVSESDSSNVAPDASPKTGMAWRLRKVSMKFNEDDSSKASGGSSAGMTKSCPSSPVLERMNEEKDGGLARSSVGWMRLPGRIFRQK